MKNDKNKKFSCPKCEATYASPIPLAYAPEHNCPKTKRVQVFKPVTS